MLETKYMLFMDHNRYVKCSKRLQLNNTKPICFMQSTKDIKKAYLFDSVIEAVQYTKTKYTDAEELSLIPITTREGKFLFRGNSINLPMRN